MNTRANDKHYTKHDNDKPATQQENKNPNAEHTHIPTPPDEELEGDDYGHPIADKLIQIAEHVISSISPTLLHSSLLQCDLFRGEAKVCSLQGAWDDVLRSDSFLVPNILHVTQRTPLSALSALSPYGSRPSLVYMWPKDNKDRPAFNEFLLYLFEKSRAGVVEVDNRTKMYLLPPCDITYHMYGTKSKGSLYVLVVEHKDEDKS